MAGREFIVGNEYTIVDVSAWGCIDKAPFVLGEEGLESYPNLKRWFNAINTRPAALRAREIGKDVEFKTERDEEAKRALFPSNYAK